MLGNSNSINIDTGSTSKISAGNSSRKTVADINSNSTRNQQIIKQYDIHDPGHFVTDHKLVYGTLISNTQGKQELS